MNRVDTWGPEVLAEWTPEKQDVFKTHFPLSWPRINQMLNEPCMLSDRIIELSARAGWMTVDEMLARRRSNPIADARMAAMYLVRKHCPHMSFPMIGRKFRYRDHTTVMHANRVVSDDLDKGGERFGAIIKYVEHRLR